MFVYTSSIIVVGDMFISLDGFDLPIQVEAVVLIGKP